MQTLDLDIVNGIVIQPDSLCFCKVIFQLGLSAALDIEQTLQNSLEREVSTEYIGELVMDKLRAVDEVAYVRFASVYRQFKDIDTFMKELNKLLEGK